MHSVQLRLIPVGVDHGHDFRAVRPDISEPAFFLVSVCPVVFLGPSKTAKSVFHR